MSGRAAFLALALLAGGCGGSDSSPTATAPAKPSGQDRKAEACAQAKRTIADLPKPKDVDGDADFANQAADALEKAGSPAVEPLRDAELAFIEVRVQHLNRAARRLQQAGGECGEREAARMLVPVAYSLGLNDAIADHNRKSRTAPKDFVASLGFDARRFARLTQRVKQLAAPPELRADHRRFLALLERSVRFYRRTSADPSTYVAVESDRIDKVRDRAAHKLGRKINRLVE